MFDKSEYIGSLSKAAVRYTEPAGLVAAFGRIYESVIQTSKVPSLFSDTFNAFGCHVDALRAFVVIPATSVERVALLCGQEGFDVGDATCGERPTPDVPYNYRFRLDERPDIIYLHDAAGGQLLLGVDYAWYGGYCYWVEDPVGMFAPTVVNGNQAFCFFTAVTDKQRESGMCAGLISNDPVFINNLSVLHPVSVDKATLLLMGTDIEGGLLESVSELPDGRFRITIGKHTADIPPENVYGGQLMPLEGLPVGPGEIITTQQLASLYCMPQEAYVLRVDDTYVVVKAGDQPVTELPLLQGLFTTLGINTTVNGLSLLATLGMARRRIIPEYINTSANLAVDALESPFLAVCRQQQVDGVEELSGLPDFSGAVCAQPAIGLDNSSSTISKFKSTYIQ